MRAIAHIIHPGHAGVGDPGIVAEGVAMGLAWVALRMLTGDRAKYFGLIFGVAFATMLMAQQLSIFVGLMLRTARQVRDMEGADLWVVDGRTPQVGELSSRME